MFLFSISKSKSNRNLSHIPSSLFHTNANISHHPQQQDQDHQESINNTSHWTKKIHYLCTTQGQVDEALALLDHLRLQGYRPNSLNISSIIHSLCISNRYSEAHHRFLLSIASQSVPDERTCNVLIARLLNGRSPQETLRVVRRLRDVKPGFVPSLIVHNRLIDQLCSVGLPNEGYRVLGEMKSLGHCPSIVSYTSLMNGFCKIGQLEIAQKVFDEMRENGVMPNSLTYSVLLRGVLRKRDVEGGRKFMDTLWEKMMNEEDQSINNAVFANLVDALCREGFFHEVFRLAEEMPQRESVHEEFAYGHMMDSLCRAGRYHGASRIVYIMRKRGFVPSLVSYNSIVHCLSKERGCMRAYQLFEEGIGFAYMPSEPTYKVLVQALCREGDIDKAKNLLHFMLKNDLDKTRIYNIYLKALSLMNSPSELLNTLVSMLQSQCQPDVITLNTVINGFCKMKKVEEALNVFNDMLLGNLCAPDVVTFTTIICGLLSEGRMDEALYLLNTKLPETGLTPGIVTYNAVLHGLCKLQKIDEAVKMFKDMMQNGVVADSKTYTIMIEGLSGSNKIDEAKEFLDKIVWPSKVHDDFVYAAILKGLCGLGKFSEACDFMYELVDCGVNPNIVNYNILIDNACKLGLKREAYQIMEEMRKNGLSPDAVTWRILDKLHGNTKKQFGDGDLGSTLQSKDGVETLDMDTSKQRQETASDV